jgi:hypothetical protein
MWTKWIAAGLGWAVVSGSSVALAGDVPALARSLLSAFSMDFGLQPFAEVHCSERERCSEGDNSYQSSDFQLGSLVPESVAEGKASTTIVRKPQYCVPTPYLQMLGRVSSSDLSTTSIEIARPDFLKTARGLIEAFSLSENALSFSFVTISLIKTRLNEIKLPSTVFIKAARDFCKSIRPNSRNNSVVVVTVTGKVRLDFSEFDLSRKSEEMLASVGFHSSSPEKKSSFTSDSYFLFGYSTAPALH